jgi:hypothetical protein
MSRNGWFTRNRSDLIFLALLIVMFFVYRYPYSIQKGPDSIHYWRQSSGLSIALNYEKEDVGFFEPTIHWTGDDKSGKTVVEFPLIYFIVGKIWKTVGHYEFIFRLLNLLIVYTGLFYFFRFLREFLKDNYWAIVLPLMLFTSPALVYYANSSLMDAPAFGLVLIGAYYYWRYFQSGKNTSFCLSMSLFLLAGLLKLSSVVLFTSILLVHLLANIRYLQKKLDFKNIFRWQQLIPFSVVIIVNLAWFLWAKAYNEENIGGVFLQRLNPIWETELYEGLYIGRLFYTNLLGSMFNLPALFLSLLLFIWLLYKYRLSNPLLMGLTLLSFGGGILYILSFYKAMTAHDYYLVNLVIVIPLILVTFIDYLRNHHPGLFREKALKGVAMIGLILMVYGTMVDQRARYDIGDTFVKHTIILDKDKKDVYYSYQENYRNRFQALESIEPYLREIGIRREDKVISIPDITPNYTLYLMDQKGVTDYGHGHLKDSARIQHFINTGAKYLIVNDPGILDSLYLQPFLGRKLGSYENVSIFSLNNSDAAISDQGEN